LLANLASFIARLFRNRRCQINDFAVGFTRWNRLAQPGQKVRVVCQKFQNLLGRYSPVIGVFGHACRPCSLRVWFAWSSQLVPVCDSPIV